jgi:hypothetical protein
MGVVLGAAYFVWFGGVRGATVGEQLLGTEPSRPAPVSLTLRAIGARALLAATADGRCIQELGAWAGNAARHWFSLRTDQHPEPLP